MASFEFPRFAAVTDIAREMGARKVGPLYLAALGAGGGLGIGPLLAPTEGGTVSPPAVTERPLVVPSLDYGCVEAPAPVVDNGIDESPIHGIVELAEEVEQERS